MSFRLLHLFSINTTKLPKVGRDKDKLLWPRTSLLMFDVVVLACGGL